MDKHLNPIETRLQELLEQKNFEELTKEEIAFIESQMTADDYRLQRSILCESEFLYEKHNKVVAPPLTLSRESKGFWFKSLPLYQTGIAVAATVLIMWFIQLPKEIIINPVTKTEYISKVDTVVQTEYIYDTVFEEVEKPVVVEKITYVEVPSSQKNQPSSDSETKRMLNPENPYPISTLGEEKNSSASSFSQDETAVLVQDLIMTN